jgi:NAD(P) transhydrogenase subunit alpha
MYIAYIFKETTHGETRVALLSESFKPLLGLGISIIVESGAGLSAGAPDRA